jgi:hypothetical protein
MQLSFANYFLVRTCIIKRNGTASTNQVSDLHVGHMDEL